MLLYSHSINKDCTLRLWHAYNTPTRACSYSLPYMVTSTNTHLIITTAFQQLYQAGGHDTVLP